MKFSQKLSSILLVPALIFGLASLAGCGSSDGGRGMETDEPSEVVSEAFERYAADEDYMQLFASNVSESEVKNSLGSLLDNGGGYFVVEDGSSMYKEMTGNDVDLSDGQTIYGIYGSQGSNVWDDMVGTGYAIVSPNSAKTGYYITALAYQTT